MVKPGVYLHFKGGYYKVIYEARHSETGEDFVVYTTFDDKIWVRPTKMFLDMVSVDGENVPRFMYVGDY
jgi:cyclomaltodextrinase